MKPGVILLAEDDAYLQSSLLKFLVADGFTVLPAGDGGAALEISHIYPGTIDLLLTDLAMPRMDGWELCKRITAERPGIKIVVMSGGSAARKQSEMAGLPFLQKPFQRAILQKAIQTVLDSKG